MQGAYDVKESKYYHNEHKETKMCNKALVSNQTRNNWLIALLLTISILPIIISSLYFLFLPSGGYQGGRNPSFGIVLLFTRATWDAIHTWMGVILIAIAAIHIPRHWSWILNMTKRIFKSLFGQYQGMSAQGKFNLIINGLIGLSGLLAAISGLYFLFFPGTHGASTLVPTFLFTRAIWDLIHTWSGIIMIAAAVLHFAIHWRWVVKVAGRLLPGSIFSHGSHANPGTLIP